MILSDKEIEQLTRTGVKIVNAKGEPVKVKSTKKEPDELSYLKTISILLTQLLQKPEPKHELPIIRPPDVIVKPPEVNVQAPTIPPHPPRIRKWKFAITKDFNGYTTEITATAIE